MERYLKRYFWVAHLLVIVACAILLAKAVNNVIEAKFLLGGDSTAHAATRRPPPRPQRPNVTPTKDTAAVVSRNMFCSTCAPPPPPTVEEGEPAGGPPVTSLPLALVATSISRNPALSSATIVNTQTNYSGSFWKDEEIPDAGPIVHVAPLYVTFKNKSTNRIERINLLAEAPTASRPSPPVTPAARPPVPGRNARSEFQAMLDAGVRKVGENKYEIDRALVDKVLGDPTLIARSARIVPSIKDGQANGFKMYAIRPNSVYAKIGMQNGDTIHSINGYEINSPDKALEVYTKVKSANNLSISLTRRGKPVQMEYTIK